ncbi:30S ribosomal protein S2 [Conexibacter sp. DBS9H8]|uniref:30S ribosomal protein S2 n=1 Tax=Conexibacter sp. DBS9H8 TaxID=2937801 RepID=UPI00200D31C3|nr:30S ribosomal protein S2 [Conexibacter sp. DBS9H8]
MAQVGIKELLEAGVHFGHQTRRWNPKMRRFIHGERDGIYIIDLLQTEDLLQTAQNFAADVARRGGTVMFVGTKKQARDAIKDTAEAADMPYVNHRWLGGLLTNFQTISGRIKRLHDLERYEAEGQLALLPTRERMAAQADLAKLRANLGGVKHMQRPPDAVFVIDLKTEAIAIQEARRLRIPIIGLVDTNCDPEGIDFVIPGNDDAIRSCQAIAAAIGDVVANGRQAFRAEEEKARLERERREAEERARREAEERARREAEEKARAEAEERARAEAEAAAAAEAARLEAEANTPIPPITEIEDHEPIPPITEIEEPIPPITEVSEEPIPPVTEVSEEPAAAEPTHAEETPAESVPAEPALAEPTPAAAAPAAAAPAEAPSVPETAEAPETPVAAEPAPTTAPEAGVVEPAEATPTAEEN